MDDRNEYFQVSELTSLFRPKKKGLTSLSMAQPDTQGQVSLDYYHYSSFKKEIDHANYVTVRKRPPLARSAVEKSLKKLTKEIVTLQLIMAN